MCASDQPLVAVLKDCGLVAGVVDHSHHTRDKDEIDCFSHSRVSVSSKLTLACLLACSIRLFILMAVSLLKKLDLTSD